MYASFYVSEYLACFKKRDLLLIFLLKINLELEVTINPLPNDKRRVSKYN